MEGITTVLSFAAMFSPLFALVGAVVVYLKYHDAPERKRRSVILFSVGVLIVGFLAGVFGAVVGIQMFCSEGAGAQCGFGGVFFTGPAFFSLAVAAYLYLWAKNGAAP